MAGGEVCRGLIWCYYILDSYMRENQEEGLSVEDIILYVRFFFCLF